MQYLERKNELTDFDNLISTHKKLLLYCSIAVGAYAVLTLALVCYSMSLKLIGHFVFAVGLLVLAQWPQAEEPAAHSGEPHVPPELPANAAPGAEHAHQHAAAPQYLRAILLLLMNIIRLVPQYAFSIVDV